jgi:4-diphosphocytidyl-2-C-methyl-D-erythritol kinase
MLTIKAPAKVNLVLEVLGKMDAYHQVSSIIQAIDLCDILTFNPSDEISFSCDEPSMEQNNLVVKAVDLLRQNTGCRLGMKIDLHKRTPWGMGLGGGSSDAAATLLGLNALWQLGLSRDELAMLGATLGADIPFFIHGGIAMVSGKGEKVKPIPELPPYWFVLLVPTVSRIPEKTRHMYSRLKPYHFTQGQFTDAALSSLREGKFDLSLAFNAFEDIVFDIFPGLGKYQNMLKEAGAQRVCLAGSGPCLFTTMPHEEYARMLCSRLRAQGVESYFASSRPDNSTGPFDISMPHWI